MASPWFSSDTRSCPTFKTRSSMRGTQLVTFQLRVHGPQCVGHGTRVLGTLSLVGSSCLAVYSCLVGKTRVQQCHGAHVLAGWGVEARPDHFTIDRWRAKTRACSECSIATLPERTLKSESSSVSGCLEGYISLGLDSRTAESR